MKDFQERSTRVGIGFRKDCEELLSGIGFAFNSKREKLDDFGVVVELIYDNKNGISLFFEAAGTDEEEPQSDRPGLERTDTVKKVIATAYFAQIATGTPTIVLTSHLPNPDSSSGKMLNMAGRNVIFDVLCIYSEKDVEKLRGYANMTESFFQHLVSSGRSLFD
jgi:hypothetical protein